MRRAMDNVLEFDHMRLENDGRSAWITFTRERCLSTWRLPKYVGWGRAKRLILGGESISVEEGLRIGLVDHLVPAEEFRAGLERMAKTYLEACSLGTRLSKTLIRRGFDSGYEEIREEYFALQAHIQESPDAEEARRAYLEGRAPKWQ